MDNRRDLGGNELRLYDWNSQYRDDVLHRPKFLIRLRLGETEFKMVDISMNRKGIAGTIPLRKIFLDIKAELVNHEHYKNIKETRLR